MTHTYRKATGRDGAVCAKIIQDWCAETPWIGPLNRFASVAAWWRGCLTHVDTAWVAEHAGRVVGFCVREEDNITGLYIARTARGRGVGKGLLDLAKADRDWITVWAYEKNRAARRFYRREGCVELCREVEDGSGLIDIEHRWTRPSTQNG